MDEIVFEYIENNLEINKWFVTSDVYDSIIKEYQFENLSKKKFKMILKEWCKQKQFKLIDINTNRKRQFLITD